MRTSRPGGGVAEGIAHSDSAVSKGEVHSGIGVSDGYKALTHRPLNSQL